MRRRQVEELSGNEGEEEEEGEGVVMVDIRMRDRRWSMKNRKVAERGVGLRVKVLM